MANIPVLEFILGLFFISLLYALLIAGLNTFAGVIFGTRNKFQKSKIKRLLHPQNDYDTELEDPDEKLFLQFRADPIIVQLYEKKFWRLNNIKGEQRFPSYISSQQFFQVLVNIIISQNDGHDETTDGSTDETGYEHNEALLIENGLLAMRKKYRLGPILWRFWQKSEGDLKKFEAEVSTWFEDYMAHASQDYRRSQRTPLFVTGLVFSIIMNIDAVHVTERMWQDSALSDAVVAQAANFLENNDSIPPENISYQQFQKYNASMHLPIGWKQVFPTKDSYARRIDSSRIILLDKLEYTIAEMKKLNLPDKHKYFVGTHKYVHKPVPSIKNDSVNKPARFDSTKVDIFVLSPNWIASLDTALKRYVCYEKEPGGETPPKDHHHLFPCYGSDGEQISAVGCERPAWAITQEQYSKSYDTAGRIGAVLAWIGNNPLSFFWKLLGFLVSAFVASLGAPFWFDMMRKIVSIKNAGKEK